MSDGLTPLRQRLILDVSQVRRARAEYNAQVMAMRRMGQQASASVDGLGNAAKRTNKSISGAAKSAPDWGRAAWIIGENSDEAAAAMHRMSDGAAGVSVTMGNMAEEVVEAGARSSVAAEAVDEVGDAAKRAGRKAGRSRGFFKKWALRISDMTDSGLGFVTMVNSGLIAALASVAAYIGGTTYAAVTFETAMVDVRKTTGLTGKELKTLGDEFLSIASRVGVAQGEVADIGATAGQLGIEGVSNIAAFTETVAEMTKVTELSADEAATALARISNAFDLPIERSQNLASVLNVLSNNSTALAGDLIETLTRGVAAAGREIGVTVDEAAALGATLIDAGISSRIAGVALRNMFNRITSNADVAAKQLGITKEAFKEMISDDAVDALRTYLEMLRRTPAVERSELAIDVFGERAGTAVGTLAGQLGKLDELTGQASSQLVKATSFSREFALSLDAVSRQAQLVWSKMKRWATLQGAEFLPILEKTFRLLNRWTRGAEEAGDAVERARQEIQNTTALREAAEIYNQYADQQKRSTGATRALSEATDTLTRAFPEMVKGLRGASGEVEFYGNALLRLASRQEQIAKFKYGAFTRDLVSNLAEVSEASEHTNERLSMLGRYAEKGFKYAIGMDTRLLKPRITDQMLELGKVSEEQRTKIEKLVGEIRRLYQTDGKFDELKLRAALNNSVGPAKETAQYLETVSYWMGRIQKQEPLWDDEAMRLYSKTLKEMRANTQGGSAGDLSLAELEAMDELNDAQQERLDMLRKQKEERESAIKVLENHIRTMRKASAESKEWKEALQELFSAEDSLQTLREQVGALGKNYVFEGQTQTLAQLIEQAKERRDLAKATVEQEKELYEQLQSNAQSIGKMSAAALSSAKIDVPEQISGFAAFNNRFAEYKDRVTELRALLASGSIDADEFGERMGEASRKALAELRPLLRMMLNLGLITKKQMARAVSAIEEVEGGAKKAKEGTSELGEELQDLSRAGRGVLQLVDAFGELDDSIRQVAEGVLSALDNFGRLIELKDEAGSFGELFSGSSALGGVGAAAGVLTSLAGGIVGAIKGQKEEAAQRSEHLRELATELQENARAVRENTKALFETTQIGSDLTREQIERMQTILDEIAGLPRGSGDLSGLVSEFSDLSGIDLSSLLDPVRARLEDLQDTSSLNQNWLTRALADILDRGFSGDLDAGDIEGILQEILTGDRLSAEQALQYLGLDPDLLSVLDDLEDLPTDLSDQLGNFADTLAGTIAEVQFFGQFVGEDATEQLQRFLNDLEADVLESGNARDEALRGYLEEIEGLDLSSSEGQERLQAIIAYLAQHRQDFLGTLTPGEFTEFLDELQNLGDAVGDQPASGEDDKYTRSTQVQSAITEGQANVVVSELAEQTYFLEQMYRWMTGRNALDYETLHGGRVKAQGVQAQGVQAQGVQAQGVQAQGVQAQGVQAQLDALMSSVAQRMGSVPGARFADSVFNQQRSTHVTIGDITVHAKTDANPREIAEAVRDEIQNPILFRH